MISLWIPVIFWILMNLAVIFDAAGDALAKKGKWILSKTYQTLMILSLSTMIPLSRLLPADLSMWYHWVYLVLMYILIRIGLFNASWGIFRFRHCYWWYLGDTSLWDKFLVWVICDSWFARTFKPPEKFILGWLYIISWLVSIGILLDLFYVIK